jgi:hypothetical protein
MPVTVRLVSLAVFKLGFKYCNNAQIDSEVTGHSPLKLFSEVGWGALECLSGHST